jgi:hypothetical protein
MKKSKGNKNIGCQDAIWDKIKEIKRKKNKSMSADREDRKNWKSLKETFTKNSEKKLSDKKNLKCLKTSNSRKISKVSKIAIKEDKENKDIENKNTLGSRRRGKESVITKAAEENHKHKKHASESKHEILNIKVETENIEDKAADAKSTKRVSLKKKSDTVLKDSDSKALTNEKVKESVESSKTPPKTSTPRNNYELRKRGRKSKKSMIYKDEDNIVYSWEKEEDMQKIDDSEFKLPNESHSKNLRFYQLNIQILDF